jgi:hypothetical protein
MPGLMMLALPTLVCGIAAAELPGPPPAVASSSLEEVYRRSQSWPEFLAAVDRRRDTWEESVRLAVVPDALAVRARAAGGGWRVLVITVAGCSDSASSVPYIARLVEQTPGLEIRIATADAGRAWMEAHRTPDDRAATPTVLLLDEAYRLRGCWVEQPAALQAWWLPALADGTAAGRLAEKMAWYRRDGGESVLAEFVAVLEAAAAGRTLCPGGDATP